MDQRTEEWLKWRREGLCASDAPIIMGESPYSTIEDLVREKRGLPPLKAKSTFILDRGNALEPIARARYSLLTGIDMPPATYKHWRYPLFRCSMDGANPKLRGGLEIKLVGLKDFQAIQGGQVPARYWPQVQAQFFATGFEWIDFFAYYLDPKLAKEPDFFHRGKSHRIRVQPDLTYIGRWFDAGNAFWKKYIIDGEEPAHVEKKKRAKKAKVCDNEAT